MEEDRSRKSGLKVGTSESGKDSLMNICLIGMPSSGKSVLGVLLAKKLGMSFLDMDLVIQEKTGQLLREIIAERGREGFLLLEEEVGAELSMDNTVLAPGGSICYGNRAMEHLREISLVIFLDVPFSEVEKRIGDPVKRGVAIPDGFTLKDLYNERKALYLQYAHEILNEEGLNPEECVEALVRIAEKHKK